jgi:hypothetical protein
LQRHLYRVGKARIVQTVFHKKSIVGIRDSDYCRFTAFDSCRNLALSK